MGLKSTELKAFKQRLKNSGRSQVWASKQLGITAVYLNKVLKGTYKPSEELEQKILSLLKEI